MIDILYTIIIWPIVQLIEICFVIGYRVLRNPVFSLASVSIAVSLCTLPLYFIAEKFQNIERELQRKMKPKIDKIKTVFKGDEQYLILSTYYRQNNYHPIYSLRNSFSLLIQVPFFIAAYSFISHLEILHNVSFLFIKDLNKCDSLLRLGSFNINVLPILMTLINLLSGFIYSKDYDKKDKIQIVLISLVFLVLLYNSPAALVIYWTINNIFSLFKNIILKNKKTAFFLMILLALIVLPLGLFIFSTSPLTFLKRLIVSFGIIFLGILPILIYFIYAKYGHHLKSFVNSIKPFQKQTHIFICSCVILFILHGIFISSSLIASSVEDFSYIGERTSTFIFIFKTFVQSAGFFLFWPISLYFLFPDKFRKIFCYCFVIFFGCAIVNTFLITENFGHLTTSMIFSEPKSFAYIPLDTLLNILYLFIVSIVLFFLIKKNKPNILFCAQLIIIFSLFGYSIINLFEIHKDFSVIKKNYEATGGLSSNLSSSYNFSKNGKNTLLIILDEFSGAYVPYIFEENSRLAEYFNGFTFFPNTVSFANHTRVGMPLCFGGYEYSPLHINERNNVSLFDKHKEAFLLLPMLFADENHSVVVTDPPFDINRMSNLEIFNGYPDIKSENLIGRYTPQWLRENSDISILDISALLENRLLRFSFFKSSPLITRLIIYDRGNWLTAQYNSSGEYTQDFVNNYSFLDSLSKITSFSEDGNTFTSIYSFLPHNSCSAFLQAPDFTPTETVTFKGSSVLNEDKDFHTAAASLILVGKWLLYLKENGVYDNTRIIISSDHGKRKLIKTSLTALPNGDTVNSYNPLLLVKDFNSNGVFKSSDEFMTNADIPILLIEGIIENRINPFTGNSLIMEKEEGITLTTITTSRNNRHSRNTYNINDNEWLFVKDNIFDESNWSQLRK